MSIALSGGRGLSNGGGAGGTVEVFGRRRRLRVGGHSLDASLTQAGGRSRGMAHAIPAPTCRGGAGGLCSALYLQDG